MLNISLFGTIFIDCKGFAKSKYDPAGRNLGEIKFIHGGVGRNVAENLAQLNIPTTFISTIDNTAIGTEVETRLKNNNVQTKYLKHVKKDGMGMWLAVLNEQGDLAGSISKMPNLEIFEQYISLYGAKIISEASHIVLELDLNATITKNVLMLAKTKNKPVYGIPGNLDVILANQDILTDLECFICNHIEAGKLMATTLNPKDIESIKLNLVNFVNTHAIKAMVITLGVEGSIFYERGATNANYQPIFKVNLVESTGAGDAFFAGTVMGLVKNRPLGEAVVYGSKVAAWTIQSEESTCPELAHKVAKDASFRVLI